MFICNKEKLSILNVIGFSLTFSKYDSCKSEVYALIQKINRNN